jgi:hypothetical protein
VNVVSDGKTISGRRATIGCVENTLEVVLGNLDVGELVVIIGVEVKVRDDVAQVPQDVLASFVAGRVRRTHVRWVLSDDVSDGHLVFHHLVVTLLIVDDAQILVRPGVAGHLVTLSNHALND